MTLQRKFVILLGSLALIVGVNLAVATWSILFLERELRRPLAEVHAVLVHLAAAKRAIGLQHNLIASSDAAIGPSGAARERLPGLGPAGESEDDASGQSVGDRFARMAQVVERELASMEQTGMPMAQTGVIALTNLRQRAAVAYASADRWFNEGDAAARDEASRGLFNLHELIEWMEGRIVQDVGRTVQYGAAVRPNLMIILAGSVAALVAGAVLGWRLLARWVLAPVSRLREAAVRIGAGDLAYRLPTSGSDEIAQLSVEVNQMAATISSMQDERVERERLAAVGEMARRIVHNIRNPLAGIRSLAELTLADLPVDSDLRENQQRIMRTVDRFEGWLSGLLSVTRPLQVHPGPTSVRDWLTGVVDPLRAGAAARGVEIVADLAGAPEMACLDSRHLEQALVALVTNAVEASPRDGHVRVTATTPPDNASSSGHATGWWEIRVTDEGPGVPTELAEKIFRPYFTTKADGNGIGLAVVRQVVQQHGGRVWVEPGRNGPQGSEKAVGAVFVVRLPVASAEVKDGVDVARVGQLGETIGQNSDHRG